ncbi:MAG: hypothetical protein Q9162_002344 [Coniocarpon cinnabarinum]
MDQKIPAQPTHEYVNRIRAKRSESQVFGIDNAERWSGSKDLVDFLDDLLNENKLPSSKFARMHKFVDAHDQLTRGIHQMELHMEAPTQEAYSQDAERNVPALQPAFLVSQQPTTELLMQIGRMYQEEMFEHKATKRMLHIQTMQRKQAEKGLWEAQIGNANAGRMLEWYQHTLNERVDSEPFVIRLREALENEQQTSNLLRS